MFLPTSRRILSIVKNIVLLKDKSNDPVTVMLFEELSGRWDKLGIYLFFKLLVKYICLHFTPATSPHPCLPPSILSPLALSTCPLYMFLDDPSLIYPHNPSPPLLPNYCQFVLSFNDSVYILLACLFC